MIKAFLLCALSLPASSFTRPAVVSYQAARSEEERLRDWIHKNNPDAEIFIHPNPQIDKLKRAGFEKLPFTWRDKEIWIQRKPKSDAKRRVGVSA